MPLPRKCRLSPWFVLPMVIALSGCAINVAGHTNVSKDDYRNTFSQVLRKSFDEKTSDNVCLPQLFGFGPLGTESAEINVDADFKNSQAPRGRLAQFKALESLGLVKGAESERTVNNRAQKFMTYKRTAKGEAYFAGGTFCYARAELDTIVKWKGPLVLGDYEVAWVYYTTKTTRVEDWAKSPEVQAAFPTVAAIVPESKPKVRQVAIDLSSIGWDIAEYSKLLQLE